MTLIDSYVSDGLKPPKIQQFPCYSRSVRVGFTKAAWMCHGGQMVLNHLWIKRTRLAAVLICGFFLQYSVGPLTSRFFFLDLAISTVAWCSAGGWMDWWYICAQHVFWLNTLLIIIVSCSCLHAYLVWNNPIKKTVLQCFHITIEINGLFTQATSGILPMNKWISTGFSATRIRTVFFKLGDFTWHTDGCCLWT